MKRVFCLSLLLMTAFFQLALCAENVQDNRKQTKNMDSKKKVLVAFFSRAGENYSVGNVKTGNTQIVAEMIAKEVQGDLFKIEPVKAYPADYTECTKVAKAEQEADARPAVKGDAKVEDYDVVFIAYPNWWGDAPMPVYTFIGKHKWKGLTVIPFCTHEGSGLSNEASIQAACAGASFKKGFDIYGHTAQKKRDETLAKVRTWLKKSGF